MHYYLDPASVDVDRIAKEMDFQALQQNIMNITFCNIDSEVLQMLKNFQSIQYFSPAGFPEC